MDFYDSIFYADIRRAMHLHILKTAKNAVIAAALYFFLLIFIYLFFDFLGIQWVYWTFSAILLAAFIYFEMRAGLKKRDKLIFRFSEMDGERLAETEEKYYAMNPEFDTFFFLDEYIYFPDYMLLIPYNDVADVKAEFPNIRVMHIPISFGAIMKIRCVHGAAYSVKIKDSNGFRDYHMTVYSSIKERKEKQVQAVREYEPFDSGILKAAADRTSAETVSKLCKLAFRRKALKIAAWDLLIFFIYVLAAFTYFTVVQRNDLFLPFIAVSAAADIIFLITAAVCLSAKREEMTRRTDKFSAADFDVIKQGRAMFGTFFMLDNCIWFFCKNTALDYDSISKVTSAYRFLKGIPDGITLDFCLKDRKKFRVRLKKWFEYEAYGETFLNSLNEKINKNNLREV